MTNYYINFIIMCMRENKFTNVALNVCTALLLAVALVLTFTVSDYYIFNRFNEFNDAFIVSQWIKKAGLLLLPLAVFYRKKSCSDIAKYVLPLFVIISCFTFGSFFDITMLTESATPAEKVFASLNEFMPKAANMALFFISNALYLIVCALLFVRDGWQVEIKSFKWLPVAMVACMPLNLFENFFTINDANREVWRNSFLWFKNFTLWHFLALAILVGFTVGAYYFLKKKDRQRQHEYLAALAIVLLIQYHSKDSVIMGDGYNVYNTVFSCLPLFICNIGVYVAAISVFTKKRILYAISFFIHAAGALTVFVYFGKDSMSNYGIFCSYSILFFCLTHCLLFALCVLPSTLGHYKFRPKDCIIPLIYYCAVIVVAAVVSGLLETFLLSYSYEGNSVTIGEYGTGADMAPLNFSFTQVNPLPIPFDYIPFKIGACTFYLSYLIALYVAYVGLFWIFTGGYYAFLAIRKRVLKGKALPAEHPAGGAQQALEAAATDETED